MFVIFIYGEIYKLTKLTKMPFYSEKDGCYQEKQKFYIENEVF